jgi:hypothetical protein
MAIRAYHIFLCCDWGVLAEKKAVKKMIGFQKWLIKIFGLINLFLWTDQVTSYYPDKMY